MRSREFIGVRIDKELADKASQAAAALGQGISRNFIIEEATRAVLAMIDNPKARVLPKIVRIVDEAKAADNAPLPLAKLSNPMLSSQQKADEVTCDLGKPLVTKHKTKEC
jgi:hypothetical protein